MSGWIKIEKDLETDPRVLRMARAIDREFILFRTQDQLDPCNACALPGVTLVCGALARLWMYADSHIRDDDTLDMSPEELDQWLCIPGFCAAMPSDWLRPSEDGKSVELPEFQAHNGVEAKRKAQATKRVSAYRKREMKRTAVTPCNADALPDQTRPDQTRPDQTSSRKQASAQTESAPAALTATPRKRPPGKKPKTTIPTGFVVDGELRDYAVERLPQVDVDALIESFRGKALAKSWVYADWRQAWQEFCRNSAPGSGHWASGQYPRLREEATKPKFDTTQPVDLSKLTWE